MAGETFEGHKFCNQIDLGFLIYKMGWDDKNILVV